MIEPSFRGASRAGRSRVRRLVEEGDDLRFDDGEEGVVAQSRQQAVGDAQHAPLALAAANVSAAHKLPMADSIIYATAQAFNATLWTQDADFDGLPGVRFFARV